MHKCLLSASVACLVFLSSGCSSDTTGPLLSNGLTEKEFKAFLELILGGEGRQSSARISTGADYSASFNLVPVDDTLPTVVVQCEGGGDFVKTFRVTGTSDFVTGVSILDWTSTYTHRKCKMEEDDIPFVLDGAPNLLALDHEETQCVGDNNCVHLSPRISRITGKIRATLKDGRAITCSVDVTRTFPTWLGKPGTGTLTGTFCGEKVDETFDYGPGT